ncbi:hypothetical protein [Holdemania massiliensis]|uniref:hypothetical protein n=1 Tax=Holdemania massiliensis TaxID=1468449 RepID=UPI00030052DB|nr:hypothetical protein [Holdemania massiliensis]
MCNIEDLLKWIELRPCMYIGEYKFDNLYHFLNGFLYDNPNLKEKNRYEIKFKYEFHQWVRNWIENNMNIKFDEERDYHYYIKKVCKTEKQCFDLFFKLNNIFFKNNA